MGWVNSVAIAQHIHRNVVRSCLGSLSPSVGGECELRRGRLFSSIPKLFRVYLRSFDELIRVDKRIAGVIAGTPSPEVQHLREASGASQDTLRRLQNRSCKQKFKEHVRMVGQVQSMWRSPFRCFTQVQLLSESYRWLEVGWCTLRCSDAPFYSLNQLWRSIVDLEGKPKGLRRVLRREPVHELAHFLALIPLGFSDLRAPPSISQLPGDSEWCLNHGRRGLCDPWHNPLRCGCCP